MLDCTPKFSYTQYMLTLSEASKDTKQILKWLGLSVVGMIALFMLLRVALYVKELIAPTPPPKPTVAFGPLQQQVFPQNSTDKALNYSLYTLTGTLPNLQDQARVYRIQPVQPDLLALNKFNTKLTSVGYLSGWTQISDKVYEWQSNPNLPGIPKRVRVNIVNNDFNITSAYMSDPDVLSSKNLPDLTHATSKAKEFLDQTQLLPTDIDLSKTHTNLFSIKNNSLSPATSLSNSQIIEVDFNQNDVNKIPIYYENPNSSNISILIGGGSYNGQIVGATYINQQVSDQYATYPLKTSAQAYEELKQGNAYIASYYGTTPNVAIRNVFLAYYIGSQTQDFLMPIIVFQGDNGFYAYVPAVTDEWINK